MLRIVYSWSCHICVVFPFQWVTGQLASLAHLHFTSLWQSTTTTGRKKVALRRDVMQADLEHQPDPGRQFLEFLLALMG